MKNPYEGHECWEHSNCLTCHLNHQMLAPLKELAKGCDYCADLLAEEIKAGNYCKAHEEDCNCEEQISGAA